MDYDEEAYRAILNIMDKREGEIVSTGKITKEIKDDDTPPDIHASKIHEAIKDLITLGEVTLVWAQQSGRLILNRSVHPGNNGQQTLVNGVWRCYIAEDYQERYHSGLFEEKSAAKEYLRKVVGESIEELDSVPFCNNVYSTEIPGFEGYGTHTIVIRGERIYRHLSLEE